MFEHFERLNMTKMLWSLFQRCTLLKAKDILPKLPTLGRQKLPITQLLLKCMLISILWRKNTVSFSVAQQHFSEVLWFAQEIKIQYNHFDVYTFVHVPNKIIHMNNIKKNAHNFLGDNIDTMYLRLHKSV